MNLSDDLSLDKELFYENECNKNTMILSLDKEPFCKTLCNKNTMNLSLDKELFYETKCNKIPKLIFQTWETKNVSEEFQKIINTWKDINTDYKYSLYDSSDREEFIKNNFPNDVYTAYNKIIPGAYKADLWRYCILYKYGGIYSDIDTLCIGKIDDFLDEDTEYVVPIDFNTNPAEGKHNLFNTFIAIIPNSEIMLNCIKRIVYYTQNGIIPESLLDFSGPGLLGRSTNLYLNLP